jgi:hypothetical protein
MNTATHRDLKSNLALRLWALAMALMLSFGVAAQTTASADAAIAVAEQWLRVADADKAGAMWEQSSPLMKQREDQAFWVNYIATMRTTLGPATGPKIWVALEREINNPALPPGEFVSVAFVSSFAKTRAREKVSLFKNGNQWVPVGYQYAAIQVAPPPATQ